MGSGYRLSFCNIEVEVKLLLDNYTRELKRTKKKQRTFSLKVKLFLEIEMVNDSLAAALKSKPSPILPSKKIRSRISTGNLEDDIAKVEK